MRTWLAAGIGALILVGAGLGGYFIGAANDHDGNRPGATRFDHRAPSGPGYRDQGPGFRDGPFRDRGTPG
jgi:hypothetical protein